MEYTLKTQLANAKALVKKLELDLEREQKKFKGIEILGYGSIVSYKARYHKGGKFYNYTAVRTTGGWFTTGTKADNNYFSTTPKFIEWLNKHFVTSIDVLAPSYTIMAEQIEVYCDYCGMFNCECGCSNCGSDYV